MNPDIHWTAYLSALGVPVIATLGVLIAYRQWVTARNKLKLELFERRMAIDIWGQMKNSPSVA